MAQMKVWLDLNAHFNSKKILLIRVEHNLLEMDRGQTVWGGGTALACAMQEGPMSELKVL